MIRGRKCPRNRGRLRQMPDGRLYRDPLRVVVKVDPGAGTDRVSLDCGHEIVADHRSIWPRRTACFRCRVWETEQ